MRDARLLNYGHLHFIVFIWGFTAVLGALISIDSIPLVWWRMGIATVLIFIYMLVRKIPFFQVETQYITGMLLGLTSALLSAIFSIMNVQFAREHPPSMISFYELLSGVLLLSLFFIFLPVEFVGPSELSSDDWLWLGILASVCTAYAFIASVKVMKYLSAYTVMLTTNLEPVYGILLAFFILGDAEQMTPEFYIGAVVILLVIITNGIIKTRFRSRI